MQWLFFSMKKDLVSEEIRRNLGDLVGSEHVSTQFGEECLHAYLRNPHPIITHALIVIGAREDLSILQKYMLQVTNWRLVLVVMEGIGPGLSGEVSQFRPRFVAYLPGDLEHVQAIVKKMVGKEVPSRMENPPVSFSSIKMGGVQN